jgi:hypothetical protein
MSKSLRSYEPEQMLLMPISLRDWLRENHLAYFISDFRKEHFSVLADLFVQVFQPHS